MPDIASIKNRIKSVSDIAQITKAMQLISVSKMRKANEKYDNNLRYYNRVKSTIKDIFAHTEGSVSHSYLDKRSGGKKVYFVIASDSGLSGEYNHRILRFAKSVIGDDAIVYPIGTFAATEFADSECEVRHDFVTYAQNPVLDDARKITFTAVELFDAQAADEINIVYTRHNNRQSTAMCTRLLPIEKHDFDDAYSVADYKQKIDFEPSAEQVFNILVPQYVLGMVYNCVIEAVRCEHSERMMAMNNATTNANEMIDRLELEYHRARQSQITSELTEISSAQLLLNKQNRG